MLMSSHVINIPHAMARRGDMGRKRMPGRVAGKVAFITGVEMRVDAGNTIR